MTTHAHAPAADPRDHLLDPAEVNARGGFVMYSVFATAEPLPLADHEREELAADLERRLTETGVTIRGWYDVAGFRAEADLMGWFVADAPEKLQAAYHAVLASPLGAHLEPFWSAVGTHRGAEFNSSHVPHCLAGAAPRPWLCVYPFVRSYDWYHLDPQHRAQMLREHGMAVREYPDVLGSTTSTFGLSDYEWLLAFEADELNRIVDAMRAARAVEAREHVREETPFFTGPRVELSAWANRQPLA